LELDKEGKVNIGELKDIWNVSAKVGYDEDLDGLPRPYHSTTPSKRDGGV